MCYRNGCDDNHVKITAVSWCLNVVFTVVEACKGRMCLNVVIVVITVKR
jgi:hypothetical protein